MEECGLDKVNLKDKLLCTYHTYWLKEELVLKTTHWYQMQYEGNSPLIPQAQESITEAKWCSKDFISSFVQNTYPSIVEVLKNKDYSCRSPGDFSFTNKFHLTHSYQKA